MGKTHFKYFSQNFDSKVLDSVQKKWFDPYQYMSDFEKFKEELLTGRKFRDEFGMRFGIHLNWKRWTRLALKMWYFIVRRCFWKI